MSFMLTFQIIKCLTSLLVFAESSSRSNDDWNLTVLTSSRAYLLIALAHAIQSGAQKTKKISTLIIKYLFRESHSSGCGSSCSAQKAC